MGRKKKILVKDLLDLMEEDSTIMIQFYAYGMAHANSRVDGLITVKDCKEHLAYDFINARVGKVVNTGKDMFIAAEVVH